MNPVLEQLREEVFEANLELVRRGVVIYTFGNASGIDRESGLVVIKPSGVPYDRMTAADMVVVDMEGKTVEGTLRPSSDLATHLVLYRAFAGIGGVVHTHSRAATAWAQARREIPCFGTTHADYFYGSIPVSEPLTRDEIQGDYEANTGHAIVKRFKKTDPLAMPAVLVAGHGPFTWGRTASEAAHNSVLLEELAAMSLNTLALNPAAQPISQALLDRHFLRKHGPKAYYGQPPD
jgi:L-ribulose-5-phosphate 4-epimerase